MGNYDAYEKEDKTKNGAHEQLENVTTVNSTRHNRITVNWVIEATRDTQIYSIAIIYLNYAIIII